jgi:hypothetical protein
MRKILKKKFLSFFGLESVGLQHTLIELIFLKRSFQGVDRLIFVQQFYAGDKLSPLNLLADNFED